MQVVVTRTMTNQITFALNPDEVDAVPPLREVVLRGENLEKVRKDRLCLVAYLLAKPLIGNCLALKGAVIPAYLAAAFQQDFGSTDLFASPVSNKTDRIVTDSQTVQVWGFAQTAVASPARTVSIARTYSGYEFFNPQDDGVSRIHTNLRLFCALSGAHASERERMILAALLCDLCGGYGITTSAEGGEISSEDLMLLSFIGMRRGQ